jgi:hypothetical protein
VPSDYRTAYQVLVAWSAAKDHHPRPSVSDALTDAKQMTEEQFP